MPSRRRCPALRPCWSTAITTCSRPIRWTNGFRRRSSRPAATAISMPAGPPTTKGRCSRTSKVPRPGSNTSGKLPVQSQVLIEGEEEVGSEHLDHFIAAQAQRLACDVVVISDTAQFAPGQPAITYGLKGIAYFELRLTGPKQDLHSGTFGGAVTNPANALCGCWRRWSTTAARCKFPAFTTTSCRSRRRERKQFAALPFAKRSFMQQIGVAGLERRRGLHDARAPLGPADVRHQRPDQRLSGRRGQDGAAGQGQRQVQLPPRSRSKTRPRSAASWKPFLRGHCPPGIEMELIGYHGAPGVVVPLDSPYMAAASRRSSTVSAGRRSSFAKGARSRSCRPFANCSGVDTLLLGWGLDDDNTHSPNEKFCLADFHRGIKASAYLWDELGQLRRRSSEAR